MLLTYNLFTALGYCLPAIVLYAICAILAGCNKMPWILFGITVAFYLVMFLVNANAYAGYASSPMTTNFVVFLVITVLAFLLCMKIY